jgi:ABC-type molybdate transport system substrate-binding protein
MKNGFHRSAMGLLALMVVGCQGVTPVAVTQEPVRVVAAGSLREALTAIASDYEKRTGQRVELGFGASGLLRARLEKGEDAQVFASADTEHPQRLAASGKWQAPTVFVRNALCALTSDRLSTTPATLLATMLQVDVRLGTSTPKADPAGDYAWVLFRKAEALHAGAYATLDAKALKLTGGADSPKPPLGRSSYAWLMDEGQADVFLTYCTNATAAQREVPRLKVLQLPAELQVGAAYALTVATGATPAAAAFARSLQEPAAQAVFKRFGFAQP